MKYNEGSSKTTRVRSTGSSGTGKSPNLKKPTILLVDDDEVTLKIMKAYLQQDYTVVTVSSGVDALTFLAGHTVDLVLLDYMMPGIDGPTVFQHIREGFPNLTMPIVFLTGVAEKELVFKGLELKPTDYLLKPVSQKDLLDRVKKVLMKNSQIEK